MLKKQQFILDKEDRQRAVSIYGYTEACLNSAGDGEARFVDSLPQAHMGDNFMLLARDHFSTDERPLYSIQENYIKLHFRLAGSSNIVFNGVGEYTIDRPQLFIVSCPEDMVKVDLPHTDVHNTAVNLVVNREFILNALGEDVASLPEPLQSMARPLKTLLALHAYPLTPVLINAARSLLNKQPLMYSNKAYSQAKAVELMCLVIEYLRQLGVTGTVQKVLSPHTVDSLYAVREVINKYYAESMTLSVISHHVGLSKTALTSGFSQLFGMTVFDYIQQVRMSHAYQLLQDKEQPITQIANAVGYSYTSNFSTAFRSYFGCSPKDIAAGHRQLSLKQ